MKRINWKKGSGVFLLSTMTFLLAVAFMSLIMEYSNIQYCNTVSTTRADLIADSVAVYAQSYDYNYNERQAESMSELLTSYNNSTSTKFEIETRINFPETDTLELECIAYVRTYYPQLVGKYLFYLSNTSTVKSVDIYGDIFVIPGNLSVEQDDEIEDSDENELVDTPTRH